MCSVVQRGVFFRSKAHMGYSRCKRYLNKSSWLPVLCMSAMSLEVLQMGSQSPALHTWHSELPDQLPDSMCMLCLRLSVSTDSGEFSMMRSITSARGLVSTCFLASFLTSLESSARTGLSACPCPRPREPRR